MRTKDRLRAGKKKYDRPPPPAACIHANRRLAAEPSAIPPEPPPPVLQPCFSPRGCDAMFSSRTPRPPSTAPCVAPTPSPLPAAGPGTWSESSHSAPPLACMRTSLLATKGSSMPFPALAGASLLRHPLFLPPFPPLYLRLPPRPSCPSSSLRPPPPPHPIAPIPAPRSPRRPCPHPNRTGHSQPSSL